MKSMVKILIISSILFTTSTFAFDLNKFKQKIRPQFEKAFGPEITNRLLGDEVKGIELPRIPKIKKDSKDISVYGKKDINPNVKLDEESKKRYHYSYLKELFLVTREVTPSDEEINKWMNVLMQGGTREGVYRALVLDDTYAGLENFQKPMNDSVINFSLDYFKIYLGTQITKERLEKSNFYTVKRILVDRSLEVLDELSKDPKNVYSWYAVFSHELAAKYPNVWKNSVRKTIDKKVHFNWAQKVPFQHIKSEVIIKVNLILNHLMS